MSTQQQTHNKDKPEATHIGVKLSQVKQGTDDKNYDDSNNDYDNDNCVRKRLKFSTKSMGDVNRDEQPSDKGSNKDNQNTSQREVQTVELVHPDNQSVPKNGARIQVLWDIEDDSAEQAKVTLWWPGTLKKLDPPEFYDLELSQADGKADAGKHTLDITSSSALPVWNIYYEAYEGFDAEICRVVFPPAYDQNQLKDITTGSDMIWRFYTESEDDDDFDDYEMPIDMSTTCVDIVNEQNYLEQQAGVSVLEMAQTEFQKHPLIVQQKMALEYRKFADGVKSSLAKIIAQKGKDYEITATDIQSLLQEQILRKKVS